MSTYSVSQVEQLTGIRSHTLRIWERRYNFLTPDRTTTNIRLYTDEQLRKLLNIAILLRNGHRLSSLNKMSNQEIKDLVIEIFDAEDVALDDEMQGLIISMVQMDEVGFTKILENQIGKVGVFETITKLIYPFMIHVGSLWRTDRVIPANEHFITNLVRRKLLTKIDAIPLPDTGARKIVLFLPEEENHELGLFLADFLARELGWRTYYLGQNIPSDNISDVIEQLKPDLLFSILITPRLADQDDHLKEVIENSGVPWICSGNREVVSNLSPEITFLSNPNEMIEYLSKQTVV